MRILLVLCVALLLQSCGEQTARRPVSRTSSTQIKESIQRNKERVALEEAAIADYLEQSPDTFVTSANGFWYTWRNQDPIDGETPQFGDEVTFSYDLAALDGTVIYTADELSPRTILMEQEKVFTGLREGLKLMQVGETATFLFPSYTAFGYYGDENKIGSNQMLVSNVTLIDLKKQ